MDFTPDGLVALAGVVLSFAFAYFPWLKDWFDTLDPRTKPLFMAGVLFVVTAGKLLFDCQADLACMSLNWQMALWSWVAALVLNQTTYAYGVKQPKQQHRIDMMKPYIHIPEMRHE